MRKALNVGRFLSLPFAISKENRSGGPRDKGPRPQQEKTPFAGVFLRSYRFYYRTVYWLVRMKKERSAHKDPKPLLTSFHRSV